jgi:hypothetical protein
MSEWVLGIKHINCPFYCPDAVLRHAKDTWHPWPNKKRECRIPLSEWVLGVKAWTAAFAGIAKENALRMKDLSY